MLLGHDVVADREAETGPLAGRLGGEERLEQPVTQFGRDADAVVADADLHGVAEVPCRYPQGRFELLVASLFLAFGGGVEAVTDQVETDAGDVLGTPPDRGERPGAPARSGRSPQHSRGPA